MRIFSISIFFAALSAQVFSPILNGPPRNALSVNQANYVGLQYGAWFCFNMSTFSGSQVSANDLDPNTFAPTSASINFGQWLTAAARGGAKYAVLTTSHQDGFALWPTAFAHPNATDPAKRVPFSVAQTSWYAANGNPDLLGQFAAAAHANNVNVVWYFGEYDGTFQARSGITDQNDSRYLAKIKQQLYELLTRYGTVAAIWIDTYNPSGTGTLTDANYNNVIHPFIKSLQPNCLVVRNTHAYPATTSDLDVYESESSDGFPAPANTTKADVATPVEGYFNSNGWFYYDHQLLSGTYTSGITAAGTAGQLCTLINFNGGGSSAVAIVGLTGTNTIASGAALQVTQVGNNFATAPTSATAGSNSATCSGTAVVSTTLGPMKEASWWTIFPTSRQVTSRHATFGLSIGPPPSGSLSQTQLDTMNLSFVNYAYGATGTSSGLFTGTAIANLTDASYTNSGTTGLFSSNSENPSWVQLDLGSMQSIGDVALFNRLDCCGGRLRDITITIYDASSTLVYTSAVLNADNTLGGGKSDCTNGPPNPLRGSWTPVMGRYIRATKNSDATCPQYLMFDEFYVTR